jgi:hypothetical protein
MVYIDIQLVSNQVYKKVNVYPASVRPVEITSHHRLFYELM